MVVEDGTLEEIAETNVVQREWNDIKGLIIQQLKANFGTLVADEGKSESVKEFETRILELVDQFTRPPFTIQRLCELTVNPTLYHRTLPKYLRALEKILLVTSSSEDFTETKQDDALSNGHLPDALDNGVVMQPINEMSSEGLTNSLITSTMDINTAPALQLITFNHSGEHLSLHTSEDKTDESVHGPTAADAMDLASADTQHEPEAGAAKDAVRQLPPQDDIVDVGIQEHDAQIDVQD